MSIAQNFPALKPSLNLDFANVKKLDPRVSFSRASGGTYYDGKTVAKAEENLLTYSQEFDNAAWAKTNVTVTANSATAPDGTTTADEITFAGGGLASSIFGTTATLSAANTYAKSFFVEYVSQQWVQIAGSSGIWGAGAYANFDIQNGVLGDVAGYDSSAIEDLGNGFYRISVIGSPVSSGSTTAPAVLSGVDSGTSIRGATLTASNTKVNLWGAQIEQRSSVTAYTPTTTQPITNYIPVLQTASSNTARFDHDPVTGESLGLLVEEQRTNLLTYSEQFDNAAWVKSNVTVTANQVIAPDGTLSMDKLVLNSGSTNGSVRQSATGAPNFTNNYAIINLSTKEVTVTVGFASGVKVEDIGNEVLRISATVSEGYTGSVYAKKGEWEFLALQMFGVATVGNLYVYPVQSVAGSTGDGYSGIYIWGAQLEAGAFPTSYIPTTASQVTRSADSASMTGTNFSSWYRQDEGTVYAEYDCVAAITQFPVLLNGGTTTTRIGMQQASNGVRGLIGTTSSFLTGYIGGAFVPNTFTKAMVSYSTELLTMSANSDLSSSVAVTSTLPSINAIQLGAREGGASQILNGHIRKIAYYPARLTNEQLQALTS